jgi:hypothetical protein
MRAAILGLSFCIFGSCLLVAADVSACDCGDERVMRPRDGERVPTTARVWFELWDPEDADEIRIVSPSGDEIPFDSSEISASAHKQPRRLLVLTPRELLAPGQGYQVHTTLYGNPSAITFDVDDEADTVPPSVPELVDIDPFVGDGDDSCGEYRGAGLEFADQDVLLVALRDGDELSEDVPAGEVFDIADGDELSYGGPCGPSWPGGDRLHLSFAAFDISGNYSGPGDVELIKRPEESGMCSMAKTPRENPWLACGVLAAIVAFAYRRRSHGLASER